MAGVERFESMRKNLLMTCPFAEERHPKKRDSHPSLSIRRPHDGDPSTPWKCWTCHTTGPSLRKLVWAIAEFDRFNPIEIIDALDEYDGGVLAYADYAVQRVTNKWDGSTVDEEDAAVWDRCHSTSLTVVSP